MQVITTPEGLSDFCAAMKAEDYITIDTEFMREKTYWPILCLIQVAGEKSEAIIDPMARGLDLAPFFDLMADEKVLKVFHAGRQDIEIIHHLSGKIPHPLFDTQVAAMVCGFGDQVGYEALVNKLAGAHVDKSSRFTDWARRPLSEKQLRYALADVTHLRVIYEKLRDQLHRTGREPWLREEMDILTSPRTYAMEPQEAYRRIKFRPRNARQLAALRELAAWREREAQRRDLPRRRVLKDEALSELATQMPENEAQMARLRTISEGFARSRSGKALLEAIRRARELPDEALPPMPKKRKPGPEGASAMADVLKLALKIVSEDQHIAPRLIASARDVERIAAGERDVPALSGWRAAAFGNLARELMAGRKVIAIKNGKAGIF